jgi:hypothetical protein
MREVPNPRPQIPNQKRLGFLGIWSLGLGIGVSEGASVKRVARLGVAALEAAPQPQDTLLG